MAEEVAQEILRLLKIEEESVFATENGAHSWEDVRAIDPVIEYTRQVIRRRHRVQRLTMHQGRVLGRRGGNLRFGHELVGAGTALAAGESPSNDTLQKLLKCSMGNSTSGEGSTINGGGATTTVLPVQVGDGANFSPGTAIMVEGTGDDGENEIRAVASISSDDITLEMALSNAPGDGDNVWNSYTAYIDPSATGTLQAQLIGEATADIWLAIGLIGGFSLENLLQLDDVAMAMFDFMITQWATDDATLAAGSYDETDPLGTAEEMEIQYQTHGTTTKSLISVSELTIDPRLAWNIKRARGNGDIEHADRVHMRGGVATGDGPTAQLRADIDADHMTAFEAGTKKFLMAAFGRTAGSSWAICLPRCSQSEVPGRTEHDGQTASRLTLEAEENDSGDASTAVMRSPMFISRL